MDTYHFDVAVIGAGIAGSTAAAALAPHRRVALIEAEEAPGYHTTGRSAAMWEPNYGPPDVRRLTGLSLAFFKDPPPGFAQAPLLAPRGVVLMAPEPQRAELEQALNEGAGLRPLSIEKLRAMVPALRPDYAVLAAIDRRLRPTSMWLRCTRATCASCVPMAASWHCAIAPAGSSGMTAPGTCRPAAVTCSAHPWW